MKTYGGVEVKLHVFLTVTLDKGKWSTSRFARFTPGQRAPVPMDRRLGGLQSRPGRDGEETKSLTCPCRESNPRRPPLSPVGNDSNKSNGIHEETRNRLNSENACYHSVLKLLFSRLEVKLHKIMIFSLVLYGCETWSLTLRREHRLRVFENIST
jgi:hypothetical protein